MVVRIESRGDGRGRLFVDAPESLAQGGGESLICGPLLNRRKIVEGEDGRTNKFAACIVNWLRERGGEDAVEEAEVATPTTTRGHIIAGEAEFIRQMLTQALPQCIRRLEAARRPDQAGVDPLLDPILIRTRTLLKFLGHQAENLFRMALADKDA